LKVHFLSLSFTFSQQPNRVDTYHTSTSSFQM